MKSIETEQVINPKPVETTRKNNILSTLRRRLLPVGLAVALGFGVGASTAQSKAEGSESGAKNTPTDIVPPAEVELIPLAKPGDDKVELIPLAKPTNIDSHQQS